MKRFHFFFTVVLVTACTKATPDPGMTKEPTVVPTPSASPAPTTTTTATTAATTAAAATPTGEIDPQFVADVKAAFAEYKRWGRVDDEMRWAPWLCRMPMPAKPHMSAAEDGGHARKLYSLFAKDHDAYIRLGHPNAKPSKDPKLQIIAKESWLPEVVSEKAGEDRRGTYNALEYDRPDGGTAIDFNGTESDHFHRYAREGDKLYRAASLAGVYFIIQKDPKTPGTDNGWVYATTTPKGEVTSAGRVASCMGCHASAKHDRLFGRVRVGY